MKAPALDEVLPVFLAEVYAAPQQPEIEGYPAWLALQIDVMRYFDNERVRRARIAARAVVPAAGTPHAKRLARYARYNAKPARLASYSRYNASHKGIERVENYRNSCHGMFVLEIARARNRAAATRATIAAMDAANPWLADFIERPGLGR